MYLAEYYGGRKEWVPTPEWWMIHLKGNYFRRIRTQQERVRWYRDLDEPVKCRRGRSPHYLDPWDLERFSSVGTSKSWKHIYKIRKQWQKPRYKTT